MPMPTLSKIFALIAIACGAAFGMYFFYQWDSAGVSPVAEIQKVLPENPVFLPQSQLLLEPFREMTIPYLRAKSYQSSLGELRQVNKNGTYTSYLTNYTSEGLRINGFLTQPSGEKPAGGWPAIVFIHGYIPPTLYETQQRYVAYVDYLARQGFVVFKIDLRGHGDSEGTPGGAYYSSDYVVDALNAYAALQSADFVNAQQIGLWGHSMAGNVVLRSLAAKPEIPAAVIWGGAGFSYEDLQKYRINDQSYRPPTPSPGGSISAQQSRRNEMFAKYGQFKLDSSFWREVAPTNYLTDLQGAIQLHHAVNDTVVSVEYSRDLAEKLNQTQVPHELFEYPTGGHDIEGQSFSTAMRRTADFFHTYLDKKLP